MMKRVFVIFDHDLIGYPPTLSLINVLLSLDKEVVFIGHYSDLEGKAILENKGVRFYDIVYKPDFEIGNSILRKLSILRNMRKYEKDFFRIVNNIEFREDDLMWFIFSDKALYIYDFLKHHKYVIQFYEFVDANFGGKFHLFYPSYNVNELLQNATNVIHCEYNRACIMNGLYGVKGKINVLPNKPVIEEGQLDEIPNEIRVTYNEISKQINNRKVILYQGIFTSDERRLEEFCEAMEILPSDFVFIAMGGGKYWEELRTRYTSNKYIFIPFVKPPYHLLFTRMASIGVLNYLPVAKSIEGVINPIYCAPNKIYEYTKYSKPIICNDIPALRTVVENYKCGGIVEQPMTPESISKIVIDIDNNYELLKEGAMSFYNSVDMYKIISNIIK